MRRLSYFCGRLRLRCFCGRPSFLALLLRRRRGHLLLHWLPCFCGRFGCLPLLCRKRRGRLLSRKVRRCASGLCRGRAAVLCSSDSGRSSCPALLCRLLPATALLCIRFRLCVPVAVRVSARLLCIGPVFLPVRIIPGEKLIVSVRLSVHRLAPFHES